MQSFTYNLDIKTDNVYFGKGEHIMTFILSDDKNNIIYEMNGDIRRYFHCNIINFIPQQLNVFIINKIKITRNQNDFKIKMRHSCHTDHLNIDYIMDFDVIIGKHHEKVWIKTVKINNRPKSIEDSKSKKIIDYFFHCSDSEDECDY